MQEEEIHIDLKDCSLSYRWSSMVGAVFDTLCLLKTQIVSLGGGLGQGLAILVSETADSSLPILPLLDVELKEVKSLLLTKRHLKKSAVLLP